MRSDKSIFKCNLNHVYDENGLSRTHDISEVGPEERNDNDNVIEHEVGHFDDFEANCNDNLLTVMQL
jgi:hypothetical protein